MVWNLAIKFLFLCLSGGMRLIKINHTHFVIAKTIAITSFLGIADNKINFETKIYRLTVDLNLKTITTLFLNDY